MAESTRFTAADVQHLGAKLDALELSEAERAVLNSVFATARAAAEQSDTAGFAIDSYKPTESLSLNFTNALTPIRKAGFQGVDPHLGAFIVNI